MSRSPPPLDPLVVLLQLARLEGRIAELMSSLDDLTAAVGALGSAISQIVSDVAALDSKVSAIGASGALSPTQQSQLDAAVQALQGDASSLTQAHTNASGALGNVAPPAAPGS